VVYTWIFHRVSRLVSAIVLIAHIPRPVAGIVLVSALLALSFLPIYGGGENLAGGGKLNYTAYQVYRDAFAHWPHTKGPPRSASRTAWPSRTRSRDIRTPPPATT